jgi:hypothetical protein
MITKTEFESLKPTLELRCESTDVNQVNSQKCLKCGSVQIFSGWVNPKSDRGYGSCASTECDAVEELGIDRPTAPTPDLEPWVPIRKTTD